MTTWDGSVITASWRQMFAVRAKNRRERIERTCRYALKKMQTAGFVSCRKIGPSNSINRAKFHCEFAGDGHIRKYVRHTKTYVRWKAIRTCKDKKEAVDKINFLTKMIVVHIQMR